MKVFRIILSTLFVASVICCAGCGADGDDQEIKYTAGREIIYEDANGELRLAEVISDNGNTLTVAPYGEAGEMQLAESKVLGESNSPYSFDTYTFAKGNHLDAYGDKYAEVEYLHGAMARSYSSPTNGEVVAAELSVGSATTASGKKMAIHDDIFVLLRKADYWRE